MTVSRARRVFQRRGTADGARVMTAEERAARPAETPPLRLLPDLRAELEADEAEGVPSTGTGRLAAAQLMALLDSCLTAGVSRRAAFLRLSALPPDLARPQHLRLAAAALDPLGMADRAALFRLPNRDLVIVWRGAAAEPVARARAAIAHLFADEAARVDADELLLVLDLPEHAELLRRVVKAQLKPLADPSRPDEAAPPIDPASLLHLERALAQANVASFVRRRQICAQTQDGRLELAWEKRFISVADLSATLLPDHAVQADPWLFRRLTRTLDRRMLALLAAPDELRDAAAFSLNLNVASILSPEFLRFDAALPARLRGQVTLDLLPTDVLADGAAFLFARDFARARGYRLLLRGLTPALLSVFPRARIGLDLLQLAWTAGLADADIPDLAVEASRIVLTRCDTEEALAWGRARGFGFFCGRLVAPSGRADPIRRPGR